MTACLIQIDGYDPVGATAVALRASSVNDDRVCHLDGANGIWWPAIAQLPELRYDLIDGGFTGRIATPDSQLVLAVEPWPNLPRYNLTDARVRIWVGNIGDAFGSYTLRFDGRTRAQANVREGRASITIGVDDKWLDQPLLSLYAGTGGAEGHSALKGQPKPLSIGRPRFVPGLLVDSANLIFQVSSYGLIEDVETAYERILAFGGSAGNYASHAALAAASIPAGRWGTCLAEGKVRHGAPPVSGGRFCYHVKGDKAGPDGWVRLPGAVIKRIGLIGGGTGRISETSVDALDAARPWNVSFFSNQQITVREAIQRIAASVNAAAGVSWLSKLFVAPIPTLPGTAAITLDATGSALPATGPIEQVPIDRPYWRMAIETEKTWDVHGYEEIAFTSVLVDRGPYSASETYREGTIVQDQNATWRYINATPAAGNAPPTLPTLSNAWWTVMAAPGLNTATVTLFQRAATNTPPAVPAATLTYTFATGGLGGGSLAGWSLADPGAGTGAFLFVIQAPAAAIGATDTIATGEWSTPALRSQSLSAAEISILNAQVDDNILSIDDKITLLDRVADLGAKFAYFTQRASTLSITTTAVTTARTNFLNFLAGLPIAWDDVNQDTTLATASLAPVALSGWTNSASATLGSSGLYTTVTDANAADYSERRFEFAVTPGSTYIVGIPIKKDAVAAATRVPALRLGTPTASNFTDLFVDTSTGSTGIPNNTAVGVAAGTAGLLAIDDNTYLAWVSRTAAAGETTFRASIFPAVGTGTGTYNAATTGTISIRDPMVALGTFDKLGRDAYRARLRAYAAELHALAKAISEVDGTTSLQIDGESQIDIPATYLGDPSSALPRSAQYVARVGTGTVTPTWARTVLEGSITCTISSGGALSITAFGSAKAIVRIDATYGGATQSKTVVIDRKDGSPPSGGGGSVTEIGVLGAISSTSWTTIATFTHTAASTTVALSAPDLIASPATSGGDGTWTVEFKWVRENGVTDVDVGSSGSTVTNVDTGFATDGYVNLAANDTGRTAAVAYTYYLQARLSSGSRSHSISGTARATS